MNQKFLILSVICHPQLNSYIIIFLFYILTRISICSSDNSGFEVCHPQTCGNRQSISFPFYIRGKQEPYCGYPGFELLCSNNGFPILNLSNTHYIIQEISYENRLLRVSHPAFQASNSINCSPPPKNLTLVEGRFQFAPNQTEVFLIYDCDPKWAWNLFQKNELRCTEEGTVVVALYKDDPKLSLALGNCIGEEAVAATVEEEREDIGDALTRGFLLNWTAADCSKCDRSGGKCGFDYNTYAFQCYCSDRAHSNYCPSPFAQPGSFLVEKTGTKKVLAFATAAGVVLVALLLIVAWCFRRKLSPIRFVFFFKKGSSNHQRMEDFLNDHVRHSTRRYSYSEIKKMTNSLRDMLGKGGYGSVYKGKLPDGRLVAIKLLSESKGDGEEFINEVASIGRTSHVNIVSLLGFCLQGSKRALIYEFMPNGSLEKFIYEGHTLSVDHQLDCKTLYNIAVGVARGLEYLHRGCNARILHFDIKPHNILLDKDFCPKISDFGLAKICPPKESIISLLGVRGTIGYIAPELIFRSFGGVSYKSDVYSYGMMVLEMIGRRKNVNVQVECISEVYFPHWIYKRLESKENFELRCIKNEDDEEIVKKMAIVSLWCIQTNPSTRPTMSKVVEMLEGSLESLHIPPKPYLTSPITSGSLPSFNNI